MQVVFYRDLINHFYTTTVGRMENLGEPCTTNLNPLYSRHTEVVLFFYINFERVLETVEMLEAKDL